MKKWDLRKITAVQTTSKFELICTFDNHEVKMFDLKNSLKKKGDLVAPLRDYAFFKKVFLESGSPTWPNGFDVCADLIYQQGVEVKKAA